jgi:ABC-type transport system, involved in lipoprotein release, permease component
MYLRILKKDIKRKKSMNIILLIFIIICAMFMGSSLNNMRIMTGAIDYFYDQSNATDYYVVLRDIEGAEEWLDKNDLVQDYERHDLVAVGQDDITCVDGTALDANSNISFTTLPYKYDFVFDQQDNRITQIKDGEIALSNTVCERNDLEVGDTVKLGFGDVTMELKLAYKMKDIVFGSDFMGFNTAYISGNDFDTLREDPMAEGTKAYMYSIKTSDAAALGNDKNAYITTIVAEFYGSDIKMTYIMDMMIFAILIVVSLCLIIIAFTLLRFTINTTIQEDYKEIGIMRAIGLSDNSVVSLYMVKYLAIGLLGSVVGAAASLQFGELLMGSLRNNIVMNPVNNFPIIPIASAAFILLITYLFCQRNTRKIIRLSAVQAIRSGSTGKRYSRKGKLRLKWFHRANTVSFMSLNDITSNRKNYKVLFITFAIGAILFLFPANATSTLQSDEVVRYMGYSKPDVFIDDHNIENLVINPDYNEMISNLERLEQRYENDGISIDLYQTYMFSSSVYKNDAKQSTAVYVTQATDDSYFNIPMLDGTSPKFANEIAVTEKTMDNLGLKIGDRIHIIIGNDDNEYLVVGCYETMMNMGSGILLSAKAETDFAYITTMTNISGVFSERDDIEGQIECLKKITPGYEILTPKGYSSVMLPGIAETVETWKYLLAVILLVVFCLISVLMSRTFYLKDIGDLALLKSIGFSNRTLHMWQVVRISMAMLLATVVGMLISIPLNPLLNRFTFGIMGAPNIPTQINFVESYLIYPIVMLAGIGMSVYISTLSIKRVTMHDLGAIE